jgi:hypothetical protein
MENISTLQAYIVANDNAEVFLRKQQKHCYII